MRILFLGYSNFIQKRGLSALNGHETITEIDIASKSASREALGETFNGIFFTDYDTALEKSKADIVYISLINSLHGEWVDKALTKGRHVIVDKPAFLSLDNAEAMLEVAQKKNLCLAEATIYAYHPQIEMARRIFADAGCSPTRLTSVFSFPPFPSDNFRYKKALGGGALWDLGSYAVTPGRLIFGEDPKDIYCKVTERGGIDGIDTAFSLFMTYSGGRTFIGHYGFNTEYTNCLNLLGSSVSVEVDRVFTTPPDLENEIRARVRNEKMNIRAPKADSLTLFLNSVVTAIETGKHDELARNIHMDARNIERLRTTALGEER